MLDLPREAARDVQRAINSPREKEGMRKTYIYIQIYLYIYKHSQHSVFTCVADHFCQIKRIRLDRKRKIDCQEGQPHLLVGHKCFPPRHTGGKNTFPCLLTPLPHQGKSDPGTDNQEIEKHLKKRLLPPPFSSQSLRGALLSTSPCPTLFEGLLKRGL